MSRLSTDITNHATFTRVFGEFIFEVQQESSASFTTVRKCKNRDYTFAVDEEAVIITERNRNGNRYELIPHNVLTDEIPFLLVENYSHWWNRSTDVIEFRPKRFDDDNFAEAGSVQYELDVPNRSLRYLKTNRLILDVTSRSYQKIAEQLSRLENKKYIHVYMEDERIAKADLVRMHIKFIVKPSASDDQCFDLFSNEFGNMQVSMQQKCGTLYGLNHGLLLEDSINATQTIIVPHAKVNPKRGKRHALVDIDLESDLRSPPFYCYQVDKMCQQLKARTSSFPAWFYLAYLHAVTSHGEPEPLTGLSGL